ncbi:MAG: flagellar basal-body rod protein FlgF [Burkholderiales bacterium]|nr:MAG: flagellar basal-body rod protein FlgF [Burkholderiales bacterium]
MDRVIYLAMGGAKQILVRQEVVAHNLANAGTTGFRAQMSAFRAVPVEGAGLPTRAYVVETTPAVSLAPGPMEQTGRALDVAVLGAGWIAVQASDGEEAYTRNGRLQVNPNGVLITGAGHPVMGDSGPITAPLDARITIAPDGSVSALLNGQSGANVMPLGRIKLVNPPGAELLRGEDGLFRMRGGGAATADAAVRLAPGALEGSNVNVVEAMITMIGLARQFDLHMRLLGNAEANERQADQLLGPAR